MEFQVDTDKIKIMLWQSGIAPDALYFGNDMPNETTVIYCVVFYENLMCTAFQHSVSVNLPFSLALTWIMCQFRSPVVVPNVLRIFVVFLRPYAPIPGYCYIQTTTVSFHILASTLPSQLAQFGHCRPCYFASLDNELAYFLKGAVTVVPVHTMRKHMWEQIYGFTHFQPRRQMQSVQLHAPAALPRERTPVPT